jgi:hypothetical protein
MKTANTHRTISFLILWTLVAIIGRLIPHPYSATPMLSLALFSGFVFEGRLGLITTTIALLVSDLLVAWTGGYPVFGTWSVFTYSAFLVIALSLSFSRQPLSAFKGAGLTLVATFGFWWWTNFGTWLTTFDMYPHTFAGLMACFDAGLPFLRNALVGNVAWSLVIYYVAVRPLVRSTVNKAF